MASQSLAKVMLHRPRHSTAIPSEQIDTPDKVIVNVLHAVEDEQAASPALIGKAGFYQIGSMKVLPEDSAVLTDVLRRLKAASGSDKFKVEIRADYRVDYDQVLPVMRAAARAEIVKMNLTALTDTETQ
jgi:biopolymer transport protein ExbD